MAGGDLRGDILCMCFCNVFKAGNWHHRARLEWSRVVPVSPWRRGHGREATRGRKIRAQERTHRGRYFLGRSGSHNVRLIPRAHWGGLTACLPPPEPFLGGGIETSEIRGILGYEFF